MIYVPQHIERALTRISKRSPHWWNAFRDGETWAAQAAWPNGRLHVHGASSMEDALQSLLGRLLELEEDAAITEVNDVVPAVPVPVRLPPVDSERGTVIAKLVAGVARPAAHLPR